MVYHGYIDILIRVLVILAIRSNTAATPWKYAGR